MRNLFGIASAARGGWVVTLFLPANGCLAEGWAATEIFSIYMKLHYQEYGEGLDNLLIMHGLFGMLDNWAGLSRRFGAHFRVVAVDLRNHGKSGHAPGMGYADMAGDVVELLDDLGLERVHLMGHSMGGKVAMQLADIQGDRLLSMVVADIAPRTYGARHEAVLAALRAMPVHEITGRAQAQEWLAGWLQDEGERLFLLKNLQRGPQGYEWKMNLPVLLDAYDGLSAGLDLSPGFDRPVLVIRGEKSGYVNDDDVDRFNSLYPHVVYATIPGAGHWLHADAPDTFFTLVSQFLEGVGRG
ncbi:MAG: alpha/beta fold hydrolase [Bacteroidetes bacterium]|jgi:esterase|nr:alpha/beta fold hydrolase [Bacteroidota bacterium]